MVVYNSLARPYTGMVRLPIIKDNLSVTDPNGDQVTVQVHIYLRILVYNLFIFSVCTDCTN